MKKITLPELLAKKQRGEKIVAVTAYDAPSAALLNEAGVDIILVGDSLANVKLGRSNTLGVTMEEMLHHTRAVARGNTAAFLVADMPWLSYHISLEETKRHAGQLVQKAGAEAVKLEGGKEILPQVRALIEIHIPVMGHVGLQPQSLNMIGGFKRLPNDAETAARILEEAKLLEEAGVFAIVAECLPEPLAQKLAESVQVPIIGIGSGSKTDGQIVVSDDLWGWTRQSRPSFAPCYADCGEIALAATRKFCATVRQKK